MLTLITGTPGSGKTLYAVDLIVKQEALNKKNIKLNPSIYQHNLAQIQAHDLHHYFEYLEIKNGIFSFFDEDYFSIFNEEKRLPEYFLRSTQYNQIIQQIKKEHPKINLKELRHVRTIYSDINGLCVDNVLSAPDDWRTTPHGSVIFYDEIQLRPTYEESRASNPIVSALTTHRHGGYDIYGITQFPVLVHQHFRAVVGQHFHLHRGWGLMAATVYLWAYCVTSPNQPSSKRLAEHTSRFSYPTKIFDYYKSATIHTHTRRIPKKFIAILMGTAALVCLTLSMFLNPNNFLVKLATGKLDEPAVTANSEKPKSFAEQQKENIADIDSGKLPSPTATATQVSASSPAPDPELSRVAMVVSNGGHCRAMNRWGDRIKMSDADCQDLSDHPYLSATYLGRDQPYQQPMQAALVPVQPVPQPAQQPTVQTASYNPAQVNPNV